MMVDDQKLEAQIKTQQEIGLNEAVWRHATGTDRRRARGGEEARLPRARAAPYRPQSAGSTAAASGAASAARNDASSERVDCASARS